MSNGMQWLWNLRDLTTAEKFVLAFLVWDDDGKPETSDFDISDFTNMHPHEVKAALQSLTDKGLIQATYLDDTLWRVSVNYGAECVDA